MILFCLFIIVISFTILRHVKKISKDGFLNLFYVAFYLFEFLAAVILILYNSDARLYNGLPIADCLWEFGIGILVADIGIWFGQSLSNKLFGFPRMVSMQDRIRSLSSTYNIDKVSFVFLIGFLFTILTSLDISYYIAAFALSFSFSPILVGLLWAEQSKFMKISWGLALCVNALFHFVQGSRGTGLFPVIFFILGYLISIYQQKRLFKKRVLAFGIIGICFMPVLSFVQTFRDMSGRGLEVNAKNIALMFDAAREMADSKQDDDSGIDQSLGRMLIATNVAVPKMTPGEVPYRGFDYINEEFGVMFSLAGSEGAEAQREVRANSHIGTAPAIKYGFSVNKFTSVEWPLFADGFSRFGYLGILGYSLIFALFLSFLEKECSKLWRRNKLLSTVLILFILYNGVLSYMYSYYSFCKLLIFRTPIVIIVTYSLSIFASKSINRTIYENSNNRCG